jgi:hypothetical protein
MSVKQFSKLSLGEDMVTTRAGAAKAARSASGSSSSSSQDQPIPSVESSSPTAAPTPTPSLVISTNNLQYDVSAFDSDLRRRVKRGLEDNDIKMKYCTLSSDQDANGMKHFYIDDDITVAIGGKLRIPKCTCGANEKGLACKVRKPFGASDPCTDNTKHIYWLSDMILSTAPEYLDEQPVQFSPDGSTIQSTTPVEVLNSKGLKSIAEDLKWVLQKDELPESENDIRNEITNMLSVFEPQDALPQEFNQEFNQEYNEEFKPPESPLKSERSRKYEEFIKMFSEYAVRDPGLFLQVRDVIDPNFQRRVFFEKIDARIARTFHALDEYIAYGPMNASPDAPRFDVKSCAMQLRALVKAIDEFCRQQDEDNPDTRAVVDSAAASLIKILDRVVDRNFNSYANISWDLEAPSDPREYNLFVALIGSFTDGAPLFVLDALRSLPQEDVLRNHWETLQSIEQKLADSNTPPDYENAFHRIVHDSRKRVASEIREGDPKRTMQE